MEYPYTPYYCEENIYRLVEFRCDEAQPPTESPAHASIGCSGEAGVVLISNPRRTVAVGAQRAGRGPARLTIWDYHVVYVESGLVYDLDSLLEPPVAEGDYVAASFPADLIDRAGPFAPRFSFVPAGEYLRRFSSDRSHMRHPDGSYKAEPPPWPAVYHRNEGHNLFQLVDGVHECVGYHGPIFGGWRRR